MAKDAANSAAFAEANVEMEMETQFIPSMGQNVDTAASMTIYGRGDHA